MKSETDTQKVERKLDGIQRSFQVTDVLRGGDWGGGRRLSGGGLPGTGDSKADADAQAGGGDSALTYGTGQLQAQSVPTKKPHPRLWKGFPVDVGGRTPLSFSGRIC